MQRMYKIILPTIIFVTSLNAMQDDADKWLKAAQRAYEKTEGVQQVQEEKSANRETQENFEKSSQTENQSSLRKVRPVRPLSLIAKEHMAKEMLRKHDVEECSFDTLYDEDSKVGKACTPRINFLKEGSPSKLSQDDHCSRLNFFLYCAVHPYVENNTDDVHRRILSHEANSEDFYRAAVKDMCGKAENRLDHVLEEVEKLCNDELKCSRSELEQELESMKKRILILQKNSSESAFKKAVTKEIDRLHTKENSFIEYVCFNNKHSDASTRVKHRCDQLDAMKANVCMGQWKRQWADIPFWDLSYRVEKIAEDYGLLPEEVVQEIAYIIKRFSEAEVKECELK